MSVSSSVQSLSDVLVNFFALVCHIFFGGGQTKGLQTTLDAGRFRLLVFSLGCGLLCLLSSLKFFLAFLISRCNELLFLIFEFLPLRLLLDGLCVVVLLYLYLIEES